MLEIKENNINNEESVSIQDLISQLIEEDSSILPSAEGGELNE